MLVLIYGQASNLLRSFCGQFLSSAAQMSSTSAVKEKLSEPLFSLHVPEIQI